MSDVLVVGDANVDIVLRGDVVPRFGQAEQLLDAADLTLGGSASIVASGLARLGCTTYLASRVGDDVFGRLTLDALETRGVRTDLIATDPDVPTAVSVILSDTRDRSILTLLGTIPTLRAADISDDTLSRARHVHIASYFLMPELAAELPGLLERARSHGATTSLDTNWDPAERWAGVRDVLPYVDVLLPNLAELTSLTSGGTPEERAAELHALGPVVAVKAGADGGWALGPDGLERAPGLALDVVDTTGAGDSFDAGFIAAWVQGLPLQTCLRWAAVAGSLSTRAAGGTPAQATLAELQAHLR